MRNDHHQFPRDQGNVDQLDVKAEKSLDRPLHDDFERRAAAAEFEAFDRIMSRETPEPDREEDRLP